MFSIHETFYDSWWTRSRFTVSASATKVKKEINPQYKHTIYFSKPGKFNAGDHFNVSFTPCPIVRPSSRDPALGEESFTVEEGRSTWHR